MQSFRSHGIGHRSIVILFCKLGVLSHPLECEMKSHHLVDFSWAFVDFWVEYGSNFGRFLADFSRD